MWKNILEADRLQITVWRMRIAYWIPKAINTQSDYVIFTALPLQKWLRERALVLRYTGCPRRNVPDFGRVFLMLNYTDITQNTYIQS